MLEHRPIRNCILIPYKDSVEQLRNCLQMLMPQLSIETAIILVDDGTSMDQSGLKRYFNNTKITVMRNHVSMGPAFARNKGIEWCREHGVEIVLLIDSDCVAEKTWVQEHLRLHEKYDDVVCIGGSIKGIGHTIWAYIDNIASWFTSIPGAPQRVVGKIYHIPTTNMSFKLSRLPMKGKLFNSALRTGEDVEFVHRILDAGCKIIFSPEPLVYHMDRNRLTDFLKHQYRWGLHTYSLRFGRKQWGKIKRTLFALGFFFMIPIFSVLSSALNIYPYLTISIKYLLYLPPLFLLYMYKGIGVFAGTMDPSLALYKHGLGNSPNEIRCDGIRKGYRQELPNSYSCSDKET